ncbi:MAG TPA: HDOD domain-containing protein, partial [Polyangiaceae bacterium]|nr:HDOD domain-containing protein [Polyangiaceae bacterium]
DEPRVLEAIERTLFQLDVDWEVSFAEGGPAALLELEQARYDVIVSDMRMPGMDGATLLTHVCEKHPYVARIVLSGQTDEAAAFRVVRVAHQFLAKPCSSDTLRQVIERTRELRGWLSEERLQAAVGRVDSLPSTPRLFSALSKALDDEKATADTVAAIVREDPAMSSKVLQVVNSSFFSSGASVSDVRAAVVRLGMKTIRNLALGIGAFDAVSKNGSRSSGAVEALQKRSLAIAQLASRIAQGRDDADAAFMAGLVCDVGELILAEPDPSTPIGQAPTPADAVTHAEAGAFLLGLWGLPFRIVEAVANHHAPLRNAHDRLGLPQIVWLAACLVQGSEPDPEYLTRIGADALLPKFKGMMAS